MSFHLEFSTITDSNESILFEIFVTLGRGSVTANRVTHSCVFGRVWNGIFGNGMGFFTQNHSRERDQIKYQLLLFWSHDTWTCKLGTVLVDHERYKNNFNHKIIVDTYQGNYITTSNFLDT